MDLFKKFLLNFQKIMEEISNALIFLRGEIGLRKGFFK